MNTKEAMAKVKKINALSFAKLQAAMGGLVGLVAGILYSFGGLIIDVSVSSGLIVSTETSGLSYGTVLAFGALIGMPIIFAICGFIIGTIEAVLYNLFARWFGGLNLDIK